MAAAAASYYTAAAAAAAAAVRQQQHHAAAAAAIEQPFVPRVIREERCFEGSGNVPKYFNTNVGSVRFDLVQSHF